ncbi:Glu/Leu/Phe/Val dehydrogenase [Colwellia sp. 4_MG-2023]|jgi:leucine dehydrogenase|uniref:Leu/Phe/Val dehydrogenase n=1 Tax=unclassified Colwellia TaxID=196834 RepID=UPI001C08D649|nr:MULTISPECIES: Glu/Leu/Phe/Val dehydrogenase [unclassified Colwellia]MBU2924464.1 amino acid dehydrogenase [Colwellia sp. C2M11]MDO6489620.1 Glu/Leu/Phe/Val dehydrogenase [Colwellia sp. 6_MG-2023]MDO6508714.1 Glu/Leu/Phe/Val dehydrogenase [Colwellia sp. 5_MG-2023]MDO6557390.1 Glu/Leu/Phe/Val dehydrogenase [Colwellia sp. 4_MG-2023]MDO6654079.1 Glu/Leu/Phe/Val dehydrogenase [Colwellia sp. 3_MG-2023]
MAFFDLADFDNHEQVVFCSDDNSGLKAIIAIHNTNLGPAIGGCRMWDYANDEEALVDVLRLSKGMTYKNAMAGLKMGGGKSVIIGDAKSLKSEALFKAFGEALNRLNGRYLSAEDVNITTKDIAMTNTVTPFVTGTEGKSGNPSPFTALGTFLGIKACVKHKFNRDDLNGLKVAVQGLGSVGYGLCEHLHQAGAKLIVTDINQDALNKAASELDATVVSLTEIYDQDVDVYAPCALGASINDDTIKRIKAKIIAGCANNQLAEPRHDQALVDHGILYAPDYVINAGGIINVSFEENYSIERATKKVEEIYSTLLDVFNKADKQNKPTGLIADEMAREIIKNGGK